MKGMKGERGPGLQLRGLCDAPKKPRGDRGYAEPSLEIGQVCGVHFAFDLQKE